jgi:hypothetical protein
MSLMVQLTELYVILKNGYATGIKFLTLVVTSAVAYYARLSWKQENIETKQT